MKGIKAFISALFICTNFRQYNVLANNSSSINQKMTAPFNCDNGIRLSSTVCIPQDYLKGEVPEKPTVVGSKIEINNLREVDDKRMRILLNVSLNTASYNFSSDIFSRKLEYKV